MRSRGLRQLHPVGPICSGFVIPRSLDCGHVSGPQHKYAVHSQVGRGGDGQSVGNTKMVANFR